MSRLRSLRSLYGYSLNSVNGPCGRVAEFPVDANIWAVRNNVGDSGRFLTGRNVVLPIGAFGKPNPMHRTIPVSFTKERIAECPGLAALSRKPETSDSGADPPEQPRPARTIAGVPVHAADGDFGRIEDFLVDAESWNIHRIVIDSMHILPDYRVWIPSV